MTTDEKDIILNQDLNDLQKSFLQTFWDSFPDIQNKIQLKEGIIDSKNFCFCIDSPSEVFGSIYFDIDNVEITVFSDFDHKHFPTYMHDKENNIHKQIELTCNSVIEYVKDYFEGDTIIELHLFKDNIVKVRLYHKDNASKGTASAIYLNKDFFVFKFKKLFGINPHDNPTTIKRLNWFGVLAD